MWKNEYKNKWYKYNMKKFDFIFLIASSDDLECYSKMRYIIRKYFDLYKDRIKYFFIELKDDIDCEICEKDDYIYVKGKECVTPGMYIKTIKTMDYINSKFNYDFVIRSNLSSFWNLENLFALKQTLPFNNFAGGILPFNTFISGTGIMLSKDVCVNLSKLFIVNDEYDDVYISQLLCDMGYSITHISNISKYRWELCIYNTVNINIDLENVLYYRVKNDNRTIDSEIMNNLCKEIYNVYV